MVDIAHGARPATWRLAVAQAMWCSNSSGPRIRRERMARRIRRGGRNLIEEAG
jgi:hypothetical protein